MSFEKIAGNYLIKLEQELQKAQSTGQATAELSYRPVMHHFFEEIAGLIDSHIDAIHEPKNIGRSGRPDWRFSNSKTQGIYGYVESKGISLDTVLSASDYDNQIKKYISLGHNLIFTDGIDFIFYFSDEQKPQKYSLINKPITSKSLSKASINSNLYTQLSRFFKQEKPRHCTEEEIIEEAAKRASILAESLSELSGLSEEEAITPEEKKTIIALRELKDLLQSHHDPTLADDKKFSDFVSQVLIFGLIYAHRVAISNGEDPKTKFDEIGKVWSDAKYKEHYDNIKPFKALLDILSQDLGINSLGPLGAWYNDCKLFLSYIGLNSKQRSAPDYHVLYEKFLNVFDPQQQFDFGAFYTPNEIAHYMVMLSHAIYTEEYGSTDLFEDQNKIIDPCCGTGSFLEEIVKQIPKQSKVSICGLEILPAPYALAKYRMLSLSRQNYNTENVGIYLTNALSDEISQNSLPIGKKINLIQEEQEKARKHIKPPLLLIIGNPPSVKPSLNTALKTTGKNFSIIEESLEDFRPPKSERKARQNIQKQITNEFMKFLKWSCDKIIVSGNGIVALALPSALLEHQTYKYARKWLLSNFTSIWILDIDEDARANNTSSNIFKVQQGRSVVIAVKHASELQNSLAKIYHKDISKTQKKEKIDFLTNVRKLDRFTKDFDIISTDENFILRPKSAYDLNLWSKFWPLYPVQNNPLNSEKYIFARHVNGVKMGTTSLLVHVNEGILRRRCKDISNAKYNYNDLKIKWYQGQRKPPSKDKLGKNLRDALGSAKALKAIRNYSYRPFLNLKAIIDEDIFDALSDTTGKSSGTRSRPELRAAFADKRTFAISVTPGPKDVGSEIHRFSSFCWNLPDNDLCKRGNAKIFCNIFPEYKTHGNKKWDSSLQQNVNLDLLNRLEQTYKTKISDEALMFYAYAILCSKKYLKEFEGVLFSTANTDRPRIPISFSKSYFEKISALGKKLAILEDLSIAVQISEKLKKVETDFISPFQLDDKKWHEQINGKYVITLLSNSGSKLLIPDIAEEIIRFEISGYSVIQQWLKMHSYTYKRTDFDETDYHEFLSLLTRIEHQLEIIQDIDNEIDFLFDDTNLLIN